MTKIIRRESRRRGFFGWIFLLLFVGFNIFMAWAFVAGMANAASVEVANDAESAGRAIGGAIGASMLLGIWASGAVIFGILVLLSRGRKTIIEEVVES